MWNTKLTPEMNLNRNLVHALKKNATISGIVLLLLGITGIVFPTFMTLTTVIFVSYLMLFAGISSAILTWQNNRENWAGWLKSFALICVAVFMIFYPMGGIATLGLLFAIYFFTDAFASFGLAFSHKPQKIWWMWLINGVTSIAIGVIFVIGWPFSSLFMVGLLVGISLLFDGMALFVGGKWLDAIEKEEEKNDEDKA